MAEAKLQVLNLDDLRLTRDHLRDAAQVLGSLQRAFLPPHPRDWQHGLEIMMRGPSTQAFEAGGETRRGGIDLVRNVVRLDGTGWALDEYGGPELLKNVRVWLESRGIKAELETPQFAGRPDQFDPEQAGAYAQALWWLEERFRHLKASLTEGVTSPVLLYPHHFDLSLSWFPFDDERQISLGWSTGDETVNEPYLYQTAYPEPAGFTELALPDGAYWQKDGFSGAILPYAALQSAAQPKDLFDTFAAVILAGRKLFDGV
jgi:hypothetical protein